MKNACMKETIVGGKTLKVKFNQDGKQVKMQILEQDEKLRGQDVIRRNELYAIKSILFPDMSFNTLFIRGLSRNYDTGEVSEVFTSVGKATEYITKISKLIGEINDEAEEEEKEYKTNKSITITTDGYKVVTATLYDENGEQLRKETAKCSPEDVFDFEVGAKLAVERLFQKINKEIKWNAKVVCVRSKSISYTKGKIYEVKNGKITNNIGEDLIHSYESMDDLNAWTGAKFIEVVE